MKAFNLLIVTGFLMSVVNGWLGSWFIAAFSRMLQQDTVAISDIMSSAVGLMSMMLVVKKYPTPRLGVVIGVNAVGYVPLILITIFGLDVFYVTSSVFVAMFAGITQCWHTSILQQNLPDPKIRKRFDDVSNLTAKLGMIIGSAVFLTYKAQEISALWVWFGLYVIMDAILVTKLVAIWRGCLKYER